jgi:SHS2 domain-containing protein
MDGGYRTVDHTADVAIEIWASSEEKLLAEGARAVIALLTESSKVTATQSREVHLESMDAEDRLVRWLNEVLWLALSEGFLAQDAEIRLTGGGLDALLSGQAQGQDLIRTELKSVTYHDLHLVHENGQYQARVVIDV